jgi:hypothetical protein
MNEIAIFILGNLNCLLLFCIVSSLLRKTARPKVSRSIGNAERRKLKSVRERAQAGTIDK